MIAELHVYGDPTSPNPTKVYTLYRLTPYTKGLIQDYLLQKFKREELETSSEEELSNKFQENVSEEEINEEATRFLRIFFPQITEEELLMLDFGDGTGYNGQFYEFVNAINEFANREDKRALKN